VLQTYRRIRRADNGSSASKLPTAVVSVSLGMVDWLRVLRCVYRSFVLFGCESELVGSIDLLFSVESKRSLQVVDKRRVGGEYFHHSCIPLSASVVLPFSR
jgi:hypothetical protein